MNRTFPITFINESVEKHKCPEKFFFVLFPLLECLRMKEKKLV